MINIYKNTRFLGRWFCGQNVCHASIKPAVRWAWWSAYNPIAQEMETRNSPGQAGYLE